MAAITISVEIIAVIFAYIVNYMLIYRKDSTVGNIVFLGIGSTTFLLENVNVSTSLILIAIPVISFIIDWLNSPAKKQ